GSAFWHPQNFGPLQFPTGHLKHRQHQARPGSVRAGRLSFWRLYVHSKLTTPFSVVLLSFVVSVADSYLNQLGPHRSCQLDRFGRWGEEKPQGRKTRDEASHDRCNDYQLETLVLSLHAFRLPDILERAPTLVGMKHQRRGTSAG